MKEVIKQWQIFINQWTKIEDNISKADKIVVLEEYERMFLKPSFYDFMEWLSKNYN